MSHRAPAPRRIDPQYDAIDGWTLVPGDSANGDTLVKGGRFRICGLGLREALTIYDRGPHIGEGPTTVATAGYGLFDDIDTTPMFPGAPASMPGMPRAGWAPTVIQAMAMADEWSR